MVGANPASVSRSRPQLVALLLLLLINVNSIKQVLAAGRPSGEFIINETPVCVWTAPLVCQAFGPAVLRTVSERGWLDRSVQSWVACVLCNGSPLPLWHELRLPQSV